MKQIENDQVFSINMFSKKGWKEVNRLCNHVKPSDNPDMLADACMDYLLIWAEDNDLYFDISNPITKRGEWEIFLSEDDYYYRFKGNLYKSLIDRFSEYVIGD